MISQQANRKTKRRHTRVCEPNVARFAVHCEIVDRIEVITIIVVEQNDAFVGFRVERSQSRPLLSATDRPVTARGSPDHPAIVECTPIGRVDRRIGEKF